jgi:hypothetical protein
MSHDGAPELRPGPHHPLASTPDPAPRSMRRTWNVDITFPDGLDGSVVADVRGRDLRTDADGTTNVDDQLAVVADIDPLTGTIVAVETTRSSTPLDALHGVSLRGGYRRRLAELFPDDFERRSLCYGPLEDLAGALLVSGYAHLLEGIIPPTREFADAAVAAQSDVCIGWAADGAFIRTTQAQGHIPVPIGPTAPDIGDDERHGWHALAPLTHPTVRRRRRIDVFDVRPGELLRAQEHLRDSYAARYREIVMHEYLVDAVFDGDRRLSRLSVEPRVLPWQECPGAVAGAQQLVGTDLDDLVARVRTELVGPAGCTHLNSTLRTLADVGALAASLGE